MTFLQQLYSKRNLSLAWKRIRTSRDISYKGYFRPLYDSYEIASDENIKKLSQKIEDITYTPRDTIRILLPKSSGLQRPITLVSIEDQIVLQAIANLFAKKLLTKRRTVENNGVCSNILNTDTNSIFFLRSWKKNYDLFQKRIMNHYQSGNKFIAVFDLSAFYDTIQHQLLCDVFSPREGNRDFCNHVKDYLRELTPDRRQSIGLPQGPSPSNFLAECVLLPIDLWMMKHKYVRYGDDIRVFGDNIIDLKCSIADLEDICREKRLIPHPSKFGIKRLTSMKDAIKTTASIGYSIEPGSCIYNDEKLFLTCLNKQRSEIINSSLAKHFLYHFTSDDNVLGHALRLLPKYPELVDSFHCFFLKFGKRKKIANKIIKLVEECIPYGYLEGKYWEILSSCASLKQKRDLNDYALKRLRSIESDKIREYKRFAIKLGLFRFISYPENENVTQQIRRSLFAERKSLAKAILVSNLKEDFPDLKVILKEILRDPDIDISNISSWRLAYLGIHPNDIGIRVRDLSNSSQYLLSELGVIGRKYIQYDPIGDYMRERFEIDWEGWKTILGVDYKHALSLLMMAKQNFDSSPTTWMGCMDSFNDLLVRNTIDRAHTRTAISNLPTTRSRSGKLKNYGLLIRQERIRTYNGFEDNARMLCDRLRTFHGRRNLLPTSHAKDKYTCANTLPLNLREKKENIRYERYLRTAYGQVVSFSIRYRLI